LVVFGIALLHRRAEHGRRTRSRRVDDAVTVDFFEAAQ